MPRYLYTRASLTSGQGQWGSAAAGVRWEDDGLVLVDPQTGGATKLVHQLHDPPEEGEVLGGDGEVIRAGMCRDPLDLVDACEEDVVADDEEEGGKGAALLDPPSDVDPDGGGALEVGAHLDVVEEASDQADKPGRETYALECDHDEGSGPPSRRPWRCP